MAWMEKRVLTSLLWKVTHAVFLLLHPLYLLCFTADGWSVWVTTLSPISLCLAGVIEALKAPLTSWNGCGWAGFLCFLGGAILFYTPSVTWGEWPRSCDYILTNQVSIMTCVGLSTCLMTSMRRLQVSLTSKIINKRKTKKQPRVIYQRIITVFGIKCSYESFTIDPGSCMELCLCLKDLMKL